LNFQVLDTAARAAIHLAPDEGNAHATRHVTSARAVPGCPGSQRRSPCLVACPAAI
jgi:hypothetical protein